MTGLVRKATLLSVCGLLVSAVAFANVPSPGNSDCPDWIPVVGTQAGVVHPGQSITIVVRDFTNNPIAGSAVDIEFDNCIDLSLCDAVIAGAGVVTCGAVGPAGNTVSGTTNASGVLTLTVIGGADNDGTPTAGTLNGCISVKADGVELCTASGYALNINALVGGAGDLPVNGLDLTATQIDVLTFSGFGTYVSRAAFDCNSTGPGTLTGLDLTKAKILGLESAAGVGSASGCDDGLPAPYCL